ncbi:MAG: PorV/PorQ family protein [Candidatus Latescibacteria bacterium]|nr:PorV/PorQ family protein [Candidatus Latescibacterota bacterium]
MKIIPSAREQAMGGAGVISALGPQSMYYNPALTSSLTSFAANFNYAKWFLDMYEQSVFLTRPFNNFSLGFGIVNFNAGQLEHRPDYPTEAIIGEFNPNDFTFYLNFSHKLVPEQGVIGLGASGRFYYSKILDATASAIGLDAGVFYQPVSNLRFGVSLLNWGTEMKYVSRKFSLPTRFLAGADYLIALNDKFTSPQVKLTADLSYLYYDKQLNLNSGLEIIISNNYFIRTGYRLNDPTNKFSAGFGLIVKNFRIEYAYTPYHLDLGTGHHLSLGLGY